MGLGLDIVISYSMVCNFHGFQIFMDFVLPYRGKLWRVETLVDLVNYLKFTKVSLAKIPFSIFNSIENIQICQSLSPKLMCFVVNSPNLQPQKFQYP